jgi:hypothetical protein
MVEQPQFPKVIIVTEVNKAESGASDSHQIQDLRVRMEQSGVEDDLYAILHPPSPGAHWVVTGTGRRYDGARSTQRLPKSAYITESFNLSTIRTREHRAALYQAKRSRLLAVLLVTCALILSACGADVNSRLELEADYSGERIFVLTMADSDVERLSGGIEAADRALETHTPEVLTFEGIEHEDDGYSATFTMAFDSLEDYQRSITALLDASQVPASDREMTVEVEDQALTTDIIIEESFYNDDLMGWAAEALIAENVVSESTTVFTSNGTATVLLDGEEIDTSTSLPRINFSTTIDQRFDEVGLDFEVLESGDVHITMSYLVSAQDHPAQNDYLSNQISQLQDLEGIEGDIEDSGPVEPQESQDAPREISATFTNAGAVTEGIQLLLGNEDASFEIIEQTSQSSPDSTVQYVGTNWTCEEICNPDNLQQLQGDTLYPEHWDNIEQRREDGQLLLEFNRGMPLDSLTSSTHLQYNGGMVQSLEFVVDNQTQEGHEELVEKRFAPPEDTGSYDTTSRNGATVYTVRFEADNAQELTSNINKYLASKDIDGQVSLAHGPLTGMWASYDLEVDLSPIWELATGGVEGAAVFEVVLPALHTGQTDAGDEAGRTIVIDDPSGNFSVTASGPTDTTIWVAVVALLLIAVIVTLVFRTRKSRARVWSSGSSQQEDPPYNVQRPQDDLTETEIFADPLAPHAYPAETTELSGGPINNAEKTGPFPDVPIPSHTDYQQLHDTFESAQSAPEADESEKNDEPRPRGTSDDDSDSRPGS